jgi:hypothetical protein
MFDLVPVNELTPRMIVGLFGHSGLHGDRKVVTFSRED